VVWLLLWASSVADSMLAPLSGRVVQAPAHLVVENSD